MDNILTTKINETRTYREVFDQLKFCAQENRIKAICV